MSNQIGCVFKDQLVIGMSTEHFVYISQVLSWKSWADKCAKA